MQSPELHQQSWQRAARGYGLLCSHVNATARAGRQVVYAAGDISYLGQDPPSEVEESRSGLGQSHRPGGPIEQHRSQFRL